VSATAEAAFDEIVANQDPTAGPPTHEQVHFGFIWAFHPVRQQVHQFVHNARPGPNKPVFIVGHSLGGALAQACATYLQWKFSGREASARVPIYLMTLAQPRYGTSSMSERFARIHRYVRLAHDGDTVPRVPATLVIAGPYSDNPFRQFGTGFRCGMPRGDGIYAGGGGLEDLVESELGPLGVLVRLDSAATHFGVHYFNQSRADIRHAMNHDPDCVQMTVDPLPDSELHEFMEWVTARSREEHPHPTTPPPSAPPPDPSDGPGRRAG
jgi:hypothetical protein